MLNFCTDINLVLHICHKSQLVVQMFVENKNLQFDNNMLIFIINWVQSDNRKQMRILWLRMIENCNENKTKTKNETISKLNLQLSFLFEFRIWRDRFLFNWFYLLFFSFLFTLFVLRFVILSFIFINCQMKILNSEE